MPESGEFASDASFRNYIDILLKRKKIVIGIFLMFTAVAGLVTLFMPKIYEVFMLVGPPVLNLEEDGSIKYFDTPVSMKAKIENGAFDSDIIRSLKEHASIQKLDFKVICPSGTTFMKVILTSPKDKTELSLHILNRLFEKLTDHYKEIIDFMEAEMGREQEQIKNQITVVQNGAKLKQDTLKVLDRRHLELEREIADIANNKSQLLSKKRALFEMEGVSSLLYSNVVQQNIVSSDALNTQLSNLEIDSRNTSTQIANSEEEIGKFKLDLERTEQRKNQIRNVRLIRAPEVSFYTLGPSLKRNLLNAAIVGLLAGIFTALFAEYWKRTTGNRP